MDRLGQCHHRAGGVEPAQVHVELAVREPVGGTVRPVHGQGRLADAGGAGDQCDDYAGPGLVAGRQRVQPVKLRVAAGEVRHRVRQLSRLRDRIPR